MLASRRPISGRWKEITRLKRCTIQSTLKFHRCSSCHIKGDDVSKEIKRITNATLVLTVTGTTILTTVTTAEICSITVVTI